MRYYTAGIIQNGRSLIRLKTITSIPLFILALCLTSVIAMAVFAATTVNAAPAIETDQPEYMEGETAYIYGSGFTPNSLVIVQVIRVDNSIVTGNGTETPGSDIITADPYGSFIYPYWLSGGTTAQYYGTLTVNAIDYVSMATLATTTFLDNPSFGLQGCSRDNGDCSDSVTPVTGWADGVNPMNGWTSGNVKGWYELENVPYRLKVQLKKSSDAKIYYITTEHDNLSGGITGVDSASGFYVGAADDNNYYDEGQLTKSCVFQPYRTTSPADLPTPSNPCIVTGPTYSGVNDDSNNGIDEDSPDGVDNDGDGKIDEDPLPTSSSPSVRRIQYTWAVLFQSSDVGKHKKWALYWKAHLSSGASGWPGSSLHAHSSAGGSQDVPIKNVNSSQQANLSITKSDSPDPVTVGGTLTYNITVTNSGPNAASNVTMTDTIPGSTTFVSATSSQGSCSGSSTVNCSLGTINNGASATVTIVVIPTTAGTISNKASVTSSTTDPNSSNNTTPWVYTTVNSPPSNVSDLSINKTDSPDPVTAGGILTYTITVTNIGPNTATNVTVTDNLPGGVTNINASGSGWACIMSGYLVTCTRPALAVGTAPVITITVTAPTAGCSLNNTASVTADQTDPVSSNNTKTISTTVTPGANLSITKTAFPDPVTAGGILTYTITVSNAGPSSATNVIVSDTLPAGTAYIGASGTGWSCTHSAGVVSCNRASLGVTTAPAISIQVTAPANGGNISNSATVTSDVNDPVSGNNNAGPVTTTVTASADLSITKTDSPDPVASGGTLTYTLAVTNNGPSTASNVSVSDTLPSGPSAVAYVSATGSGWSCSHLSGVVTCTRSSLAEGAAPVITITVTAPVTASAVSITNSATVSASTSDLISGNNTATASTTVNATADLSITKTDTPDPVTVGGTLTYTLAVTNNGPSTASTVSVSDTLPAGVTYGSASGTGWACSQSAGIVTCTRSTLALGAAPPITITVTAPGTSGSITNSATVSTITNDPTIGNNTATASTTVNAAASADLEMVSNIDAPDPVVAGASMTYTYTVINNGPSTATNLDVKGYLPPGVTYVSAVGTGWTCSESSLVVTCTRTSLTSGTTAPIIVITVLAKSEGGTMSSSATVSSSVGDPIASNNSKTAGTNVTSSSDLSIIKTGPATVTTNGAMTYTLAVTNNGPSTATSVSVSDTLPAGVTFTSFSAAGWNCVHNTGLVSCTLPSSLAPGAAPSIAINATAPSTPGPISNTATVSSAVNDPVNGNNSSTLSTSSNSPPLTSADLSITKTDSPDPVLVNQNLTYLITVTNNGPDAATGVSVTDTLPAGVTYVSATPSQGSCSQAAGTVTCPIGTIAYPGSATVTIVVTPTAAGTLNNSAGVSSTTSDPNGSNNNVGPVSTVVNSAPGIGADLSVTNTDSPDPVPLVGGHVTYTIVVTNNGPGSATGVTMTDLLDASTALFGSPVSSQGTCSGTTTITCAIGTLASGSSATVTVVTT
ncbi:MAG: DUF11 domain-containing protein, partial [Nitrospirae bacterium]|nr:DUF11 domain-containing protein [Nitrospirota bacterium]